MKRANALPKLQKANAKRVSFLSLLAASVALAAVANVAVTAEAVPMSTPRPGPSATNLPTPKPPPNVLPFNTLLTLVLDGTISSGSSKADEIVNAHLKDAIVLNDQTVFPAGTPVRIRILDAAPATNPDIYGFVDIYYEPLQLVDGRAIKIRPVRAHLNVNPSAGHESTVGVENTVGDIFAPGILFHIFRKGRNFTLEPGAEIHAYTEAAIELTANGTIAISTPPPLVLEATTPHSSFKSMPMATPNPSFRPALDTSSPQPNSTPH